MTREFGSLEGRIVVLTEADQSIAEQRCGLQPSVQLSNAFFRHQLRRLCRHEI